METNWTTLTSMRNRLLASIAILALAGYGCADDPASEGEERRVEVEQRRYLAGLDEWVEVVKTPATSVAVRADGSRVAWPSLQLENRRAWRARHGAMTGRLVEQLSTTTDGELSALVAFDPSSEYAADPDRRAALLAVEGVEIQRTAQHAPLAAIRGTREALQRVSRLPGVEMADVGDYGRPVEHYFAGSPSCPSLAGGLDPITFHDIGTDFNAFGNFGEGQLIGLVEASQDDGGACGHFRDHQAFTFANFAYRDPPRSCTTDMQCMGPEMICDTCVNGYCTGDHATQVASVISSSIDFGGGGGLQARGASHATFVYSNDETSFTCTAAGLISVYDFMIANGVPTTNETFGCEEYTVGPVEDYYQLTNEELLVVRSAGNDPIGGRACEGTSNSLCVGSSFEDPFSGHTISCFQSDLNPSMSDREEPDLVAGGGEDPACAPSSSIDVLVADPRVDCCWAGSNGTSFSAPSATAIVALHRERCEPDLGPLSGRQLRATLRTMSYRANPDGELRYSTPKQFDYEDGAGLLTAFTWCGSGAEDGWTVGAQDQSIDLSTGTSMPGGETAYTPGEPRETGGVAYPLYTSPTDASRVGLQVGALEGKRDSVVRWSLSWDGCISTPEAVGAASPAVDYDLFLYNRTTNTYIYGSQSIDDVNEGFDVIIQSSDLSSPKATDVFEIWVSWPSGSTACGGGTMDEIAWAWALR